MATEFKTIKVTDDCADLNAAAAEGWAFISWMPVNASPWPTALLCRTVPAVAPETSSSSSHEETHTPTE